MKKFLLSLLAIPILSAGAAFAQYYPESRCTGEYAVGWCLSEDDGKVFAFTYTEDWFQIGYSISPSDFHALIISDPTGNVLLEVGKYYGDNPIAYLEGDQTLVDIFAEEILYSEALIQGYLAND